MSDARRDDKREAAGTHTEASAPPSRGPDLDCSEMPDLLVKLHLAEDAFDDQPELLQAISIHLDNCEKCRRITDSIGAAIAAIPPPDQEEIDDAWAVLKAEVEREQLIRSAPGVND